MFMNEREIVIKFEYFRTALFNVVSSDSHVIGGCVVNVVNKFIHIFIHTFSHSYTHLLSGDKHNVTVESHENGSDASCVVYLFIYFLHEHNIYFNFNLCRAQLNNCIDWIYGAI